MQTIGITGGIGSGKSLVSKILEAFGYPVFNSDSVSKQLTDTDPLIKEKLIDLFGPEVYTPDGLNRSFLAQQIFNNDSLRLQVNAIIHPQVRKAFSDFCTSHKSDFIFNEAAILIETGAYKNLDHLVLVTAPEEIRVRRVISRDKTTDKEVLQRMSKQWNDDQKRPFASFEIVNDGRQPLLEQVESMLAYFTSSQGS